jgi:hypothetical protein
VGISMGCVLVGHSIASIKEFGSISSDVLRNKKSSTRMISCILSNIKDKVVQETKRLSL